MHAAEASGAFYVLRECNAANAAATHVWHFIWAYICSKTTTTTTTRVNATRASDAYFACADCICVDVRCKCE